MKKLFCVLLLALLASPASARELSRGDWVGADDCRDGTGDCFAQTLLTDDDFGAYRLVIRFVIGKFQKTGIFQAGFEAALVPKGDDGDDGDAVVRQIVFHTEGPPKFFKAHNIRRNDQGLRFAESFSQFEDGDPVIVDLVNYLRQASTLDLTLAIETGGEVVTREVALSLKGSSYVLKNAFGELKKKETEYGAVFALDLLAAFPVDHIKSCERAKGLAAVLAETTGKYNCQDLGTLDVSDSSILYKTLSAKNEGLVFQRTDRMTFRVASGNLSCAIDLLETPEPAFEDGNYLYLKTAERCGDHDILIGLPKPGGQPVSLRNGLADSEEFREFVQPFYSGGSKTLDTLFK